MGVTSGCVSTSLLGCLNDGSTGGESQSKIGVPTHVSLTNGRGWDWGYGSQTPEHSDTAGNHVEFRMGATILLHTQTPLVTLKSWEGGEGLLWAQGRGVEILLSSKWLTGVWRVLPERLKHGYVWQRPLLHPPTEVLDEGDSPCWSRLPYSWWIKMHTIFSGWTRD